MILAYLSRHLRRSSLRAKDRRLTKSSSSASSRSFSFSPKVVSADPSLFWNSRIVESVKSAMQKGVHPKLIAKGSSGSYFARDEDGHVVG